MIPKEKAKELIEKMEESLEGLEAIKQCALKTVDEVIKELDRISIGESGTTLIDYGQSEWREVKEEIENL